MTAIAQTPILYSFRRCPYAMRARLALAASGQICELREVSLKSKPAQMLEASPKGTVPVLVLGNGQILEESLDIMLWALTHNDPLECLPASAQHQQNMMQLIAQNDGPFKFQLDRYKYPNRYPGEITGPQARDAAASWLYELNQRLNGTDYLFGSRRSLADMAIAPFIRQFAHTDSEWFNKQAWPNLHAWLQRFLNSEAFAQVMVKYPPWTAEQAPTLFPPTDVALRT